MLRHIFIHMIFMIIPLIPQKPFAYFAKRYMMCVIFSAVGFGERRMEAIEINKPLTAHFEAAGVPCPPVTGPVFDSSIALAELAASGAGVVLAAVGTPFENLLVWHMDRKDRDSKDNQSRGNSQESDGESSSSRNKLDKDKDQVSASAKERCDLF